MSSLKLLRSLWYLCGREENLDSISATNKWTSVSVRVERVGLYLATHTHTDIDLFVYCMHVCVRMCVSVCKSPASSRPTLIWADGCHGSGSRLLHSSINSIDLDTGCTAPTESGGEITDPDNISNNGTPDPKLENLVWSSCMVGLFII